MKKHILITLYMCLCAYTNAWAIQYGTAPCSITTQTGSLQTGGYTWTLNSSGTPVKSSAWINEIPTRFGSICSYSWDPVGAGSWFSHGCSNGQYERGTATLEGLNAVDVNPSIIYPNGCSDLPDPCQDQIDAKAVECGGAQFVDTSQMNPETCEPITCTCVEQRQEADEYCADGYEFDSGNCTYQCHNCEEYYTQVAVSCDSLGQEVWWVTCNINDSFNPEEKYVWKDHQCKDVASTQPPLDSPDHDDPSNVPQQTPEPTPTPNPSDTPDQQQLQILQTINNNQSSVINNQNQSNTYLSNIAENTVNQNNTLNILNESVNELGKQMAAQQKASEGFSKGEKAIQNEVKEVNETLNDMKYEGPVPNASDTDFNSELDDSNNYDEYSDPIESGTQHGQSDSQSIIDDYGSNPAPYTASITADSNACINGVVMGANLNICFNKPWMLTGYAIMKAIMIGIAYLQTAILLNRAIAS